MTDPDLKRLVDALDTATAWATSQESQPWQADLDVAELRLRCLRKRLGDAVKASPYLAFLGRVGAGAATGRSAVAAGA
jgi:hypothetical protein